MPNYLFYGDNVEIMRRRIADESVDLCYIDPPFNSKRNYNQIYLNIGEDKAQSQAFIDTWTWNEHAEYCLRQVIDNDSRLFTVKSIDLILALQKILGKGSFFAYLVNMTVRIAEIFRVLKKTGSFYLHCDPTASHYLKLILDAIFCEQGGNMRNEIIWCYRGAGYPKNDFGRRHDTIFRYTKSEYFTFNLDAVREEYAGTTKERFKHYIGNVRGNQNFGLQKLNPLGKQPDDWWQIQPIAPSAKERLGYPTQKPEALLEKIIQASSNPGDIILDAYCGCGTTVAVAQRLQRQWIGIDITYQSISLILKRLEDTFGKEILQEIILSGLPKDIAAAKALAHKKDDRLRKEFEKWAILTYSNNRALINEKKGSDKGIDGIAYLFIGKISGKERYQKVIFSVKSGQVNPSMIRDLQGVLSQQEAVMGIFITLENPTKGMLETAAQAGIYTHPLTRQVYPILQIITVQQILDGQRLQLPMAVNPLKSAARKNGAENGELEI